MAGGRGAARALAWSLVIVRGGTVGAACCWERTPNGTTCRGARRLGADIRERWRSGKGIGERGLGTDALWEIGMMQRVVDGEGVDVWWDAPGQLDVGQSTSASGGHCAVSWRGGHRALQRTELMAVLTVLRGAVPAACGDGNGHFWSGARMDEKATRMEEGEHGQSCGGRCPRSRGSLTVEVEPRSRHVKAHTTQRQKRTPLEKTVVAEVADTLAKIGLGIVEKRTSGGSGG